MRNANENWATQKCLWDDSVLMVETRFLHRNSLPIFRVVGDDIMRVQDVRKWCRDLENDRNVIHGDDDDDDDDDRTCRPST